MHVVRDSLVESFRTMRTSVFLAVTVYLEVTAQIASVIEHFTALRTAGCKLLCTFVHGPVQGHTHTTHQHTSIGEGLSPFVRFIPVTQ